MTGVVTRSQELELRFYQQPDYFKEDRLEEYWLAPTAENHALADISDKYSGLHCRQSEWDVISEGVRRLRSQKVHYGFEKSEPNSRQSDEQSRGIREERANDAPESFLSRKVIFAIRQVALSSSNTAIVTTQEQWYCPIVDAQGERVPRNSLIGPFKAEYFLVRSKDRWLIYKSTVPRFGPAWTKRHGLVLAFSVFLAVILFLRMYQLCVRPPIIRLKQ